MHFRYQKLLPQIAQTVALVCKLFPQGHNVIVGIACCRKNFPKIPRIWYGLEGSQNSRFVLGHELITNPPPAKLARKERTEEIPQVKEGNENPNGDVDPRLGVDWGVVGGQEIGNSQDSQRASH